ncbi:(2Fe-2S)-binding protein [Rhizobium grahamii]|uniref:Uncharacterized protein n=1 Tax=Rhizobium grahamii CCGE 502 TaxID=990285 RepID=S3HE77_9HYPH|nr:(2Fe-2S)-binding protein [Rhizobium grahamii]EPE97034.1 hypothetical protein RGCCGE502_16760 [Rhizobium grahamii CCGE 502]
MARKHNSGPATLAVVEVAPVNITVDDRPVSARRGESVLTALRLAIGYVRSSDFSQQRRSGFCIMGACQDCWIWRTDGRRLRACTTRVEEGMQLMTTQEMLP